MCHLEKGIEDFFVDDRGGAQVVKGSSDLSTKICQNHLGANSGGVQELLNGLNLKTVFLCQEKVILSNIAVHFERSDDGGRC